MPAATAMPATAMPATAMPTAVPTPAPSGTRGGVIVLGSAGEPAHVDPLVNSADIFFQIWGNVYNPLIQFSKTEPLGELVPGLAESWQVGPTGQDVTFNIRSGVTWHDGRPLTAEDAAFGVELLRTQGAFTKGLLKSIASTETPSPSTLKVNLNRSQQSILAALGLNQAIIIPKHVYDAAGGDLKEGPSVGTGPFKEDNYDRGVSLDLVRNDDYFESGLPFLDGVKVLIVKDSATRLAAFRSGQIDVLGIAGSGPNAEQIEDLKRSVPDLQSLRHNTMATQILEMNSRREPWSDVRVRRAAFLAIDRFEATKVLTNALKPAGPLIPDNWAIPDDELFALPGYRQGADKEQDLAEARRLLAEAGFPNGFEAEGMALQRSKANTNALIFVKDQLEKVGIRINTIFPVDAEYFSRREMIDFELRVSAASISLPDPDGTSRNVLTGPFNPLDDARLVELFEAQSAEVSPTKRQELVFEMERRMIEIVNQAPIIRLAGFWVAQQDVRGFLPPLGLSTGSPLMEHVWLDR